MEELMQVIEVLGYILVFGALVWGVKILNSLKMAIDSQKAIIESLRANMGYVEGLQNTVSKLYDPSEVEKLVSIKVQTKILEQETKIRKQGEVECSGLIVPDTSISFSYYVTRGEYE